MTEISDYLTKEAAKADEKADELYGRIEKLRNSLDYHIASVTGDAIRSEANAAQMEADFYRGVSSGYRLAAWAVRHHAGTPAHD